MKGKLGCRVACGRYPDLSCNGPRVREGKPEARVDGRLGCGSRVCARHACPGSSTRRRTNYCPYQPSCRTNRHFPQGKMHTWWLLPDNDPQPGPAPGDAPAAHSHAPTSTDKGGNGGNGNGNGNGNGSCGDPCRRASSSRLSLQPGDSDTLPPLQKSPVAAPLTPRRPFLYGSRRGDSNASISTDGGRHTGGSVLWGAAGGLPASPASGSVDLMPPFARSKSKARVDLRLFQAGQGKGQG